MHCFKSLSKTVAHRKTSHPRSEYLIVATCTTVSCLVLLSCSFVIFLAWQSYRYVETCCYDCSINAFCVRACADSDGR